jgi:hypothetical protein
MLEQDFTNHEPLSANMRETSPDPAMTVGGREVNPVVQDQETYGRCEPRAAHRGGAGGRA